MSYFVITRHQVIITIFTGWNDIKKVFVLYLFNVPMFNVTLMQIIYAAKLQIKYVNYPVNTHLLDWCLVNCAQIVMWIYVVSKIILPVRIYVRNIFTTKKCINELYQNIKKLPLRKLEKPMINISVKLRIN